MSENNTYHRGKNLETQQGKDRQVKVATVKILVNIGNHPQKMSNHARLKRPTKLESGGKRLEMERIVSTP
jgi:hypothetical protein